MCIELKKLYCSTSDRRRSIATIFPRRRLRALWESSKFSWIQNIGTKQNFEKRNKQQRYALRIFLMSTFYDLLVGQKILRPCLVRRIKKEWMDSFTKENNWKEEKKLFNLITTQSHRTHHEIFASKLKLKEVKIASKQNSLRFSNCTHNCAWLMMS